ncbi:MAG: Superoxide dismutase [Parcubacteria group bacterium GW2011_GWC1_45_14]|nr:MAG: Superoxide dismutase [Parcubacteria group bacterium GW2011_GWC1_45_14]
MYELKNFESILGNGVLSDELLKGHFGLYEGYVKNTNGALDIMKKEEGIYEFGEVSRRFGWEWNGMRLHELYFSNMMKGGSELEKGSDLYKKIEEDFGSYENWEKNFKAKASMRGIGWVILYLDKESGKLFNTWINEHDGGHLSGADFLKFAKQKIPERGFLYALARLLFNGNEFHVEDECGVRRDDSGGSS